MFGFLLKNILPSYRVVDSDENCTVTSNNKTSDEICTVTSNNKTSDEICTVTSNNKTSDEISYDILIANLEQNQ